MAVSAMFLEPSLTSRGDSVLVRLSSEQRQQLPHKPLELIFANVTVYVEKRRVLHDVSGMVKPGQLLAVMGPSGSGKTTLLNCLAGRTKLNKGSIRLNRENLNKRSKRKICYVLQQDIFFPDLTLRQTLQYAAMLRLPDSMTYKQKMLYVDHIIAELDLTNCQHTIMGDYMKRGLSGGEKKRANIACELLTNPALMLLDEPTSGLDSYAANNLMSTLKKHAKNENKTVVVTVHQPSSQIFHMFDKLLLLCNGQTAYFGDVDKVVNFFSDIGLRVKPHYNPADFILEQVKGCEETKEKILKASREARSRPDYPHELQLEFYASSVCHRYLGNYHHEHDHDHGHGHHHVHVHDHDHDHRRHHAQANGLSRVVHNAPDLCADNLRRDDPSARISDSSIRESGLLCSAVCSPHSPDSDARLYTAIPTKEEEVNAWLLDNQSHASSSGSSSDYDFSWQWPTCFWTQFKVLSQRNFQEAKPRMLSKLNWVQTVALGLMAGFLWFNLPRTEHAIHDIQGWMFFSTTYWMLFSHFGALYSLPAEREVINKERQSGAYRLSAYYLAKMVGELPLTITLPAVYHLISYPLLGSYSSKAFFLLLAILLLNTIVAQSVGFFIGACCEDMQVSITISAIYTLGTQLFGGYLATNIPPWFIWMKHLSMIHYAYQNMQIVEFSEGAPIECARAASKFEACQSSRYIPATDILNREGSALPLWLNSLILLVFLVVFRTLGYVALRFFRKPK